MFGLGIPELLLILLAVLLLFGSAKLPQLGKAMGETIRTFRKALREPQADAEKRDAAKETAGK
jgi:sec-independent protein translocase protein TatA